VESALIYPLTLLLILGLIFGGLGIFRYQQMAALAREGARWASVHGDAYARETGNPATTAHDVFKTAIQPKAVALYPNCLNYTVTWSPDQRAGSTVTVTLSYRWVPEAFYNGAITLTSTSNAVMTH
jgi:Flp pilus assembly protein TadG